MERCWVPLVKERRQINDRCTCSWVNKVVKVYAEQRRRVATVFSVTTTNLGMLAR